MPQPDPPGANQSGPWREKDAAPVKASGIKKVVAFNENPDMLPRVPDIETSAPGSPFKKSSC